MKIYQISSKNEEDAQSHIHKSLLKYIKDVDSKWNYITPKELKGKESKYFILDIRDKDAYKKGHIKGAKNIFWMDLLKEDNIDKLPKDKTILLVCYVGHTASQMLLALSLLGYNVKSLKFGMGQSPVEGVPVAGWTDYGYSVSNEE